MWLRMPLIPVAIAFGAGIAVAGRMPLVAVWSVSLGALAMAVLALAVGRPIVATVVLLLDVAAIGVVLFLPARAIADAPPTPVEPESELVPSGIS